MAPIRRYLRISKHSVLECRIFMENPADGPRWLLNAQDPALPRVFEAIRPLVLPKLREENERAKGKGKKKKSVKDVVTRDDFEVVIFLTEVGTRHSVLIKSKTFNEPALKVGGGGSGSNSVLPGGDAHPVVIQEESDDEGGNVLDQIPMRDSDASDEDNGQLLSRSGGHRGGGPGARGAQLNEEDDKKLGFKTRYDGFGIWGLVLCLLVTRKGGPGKNAAGSAVSENEQALMQDWIASTQPHRDDD